MARPIVPLTDTKIRNAKATNKDLELRDGNGLILLVRKSGTKTWQQRYQHPLTKKRLKLTFGSYPALSLKHARGMREEVLSLLAQGIDPAEHEAQKKAERLAEEKNTFGTIALDWLEVKSTSVTADYAHDIRRSLELHVFPYIADLPITHITSPTLINILKPLRDKGTLETLKRVVQRLNEIFVFAINTGSAISNPAFKISCAFEAPKATHQPTISPDALPEFMQCLIAAQIRRETRALIEFQLHTMTRPSEASGAMWSEIDFDKRLWTIPAKRMKANREHLVPLSDQVIAILEFMLSLRNESLYIFPSIKDSNQPMNSQTANQAIKRMGYANQLVSHGLRSIASTTLNEQEFDPDVIEACLAHVDRNQVRRAYNRTTYLNQRLKVMQWWSDHIDACSRGEWRLAGYRTLKLA